MNGDHRACSVAVVPGDPEVRFAAVWVSDVCVYVCVCHLQRCSHEDSLVLCHRLDAPCCMFGPGYLHRASRASRVRLTSRICAASVCMGCMERSSSSQRAIRVYMPCGSRNIRPALRKMEPNEINAIMAKQGSKAPLGCTLCSPTLLRTKLNCPGDMKMTLYVCTFMLMSTDSPRLSTESL